MSMNKGSSEMIFIQVAWCEISDADFKIMDWVNEKPNYGTYVVGTMITDCKSLYDVLEIGHKVPACKRTGLEVLALRETQRRYQQSIRWVATEEMLADPLTKIIPKLHKLHEVLQTGKCRIVQEIGGLAKKLERRQANQNLQEQKKIQSMAYLVP